MNITAEVTVTLATVELNNDYQVEVKQRRRRQAYTPQEAMAFAAQITATAMDAQAKLTADLAHETVAHEFDLAPICPDCRDGKHGACIGSAFIENGPEVDETDCGCEKAGHPTGAREVRS